MFILFYFRVRLVASRLPMEDPRVWFDATRATHVPCATLVHEPNGAMGRHSVRTTGHIAPGTILFMEEAFVYSCELLIDPASPIAALIHFASDIITPANALLRTVENDRARLCALGLMLRATHPLDLASAPLETLADEMCIANALPLVMNASTMRYATGLFRIGSRVNHSCEPNSAYFSHGKWVIFYATRALAPDDEVTITYLGEAPHFPRGMRREYLLDHVGFHCACARCKREAAWPTPTADYWATHNSAQRWRKLVFDQIGMDVPALSRLPSYKLSLVYLDQNGPALRAHPLVRAYVANALAKLLIPVWTNAIMVNKEEAAQWFALYAAAHPYLCEHTSARTHATLKLLSFTLVFILSVKGPSVALPATLRDMHALPPAMTALAQFAADEYVFYNFWSAFPTLVRHMEKYFASLEQK